MLKHKAFQTLAIAISLLIPSFALPRPTIAAQRIYVSYSAFERSISVDALEIYATKGIINDDLAAYANYTEPQVMERLRRVLITRVNLDPVAVSQFFYTPQGEDLLQRLGQIIQTESRQTGVYALRSALVLAAADKEGLTLLNVLRYFPSNSIRVDLNRSLQLADEVETIVNRTNTAIASIANQSETEANSEVIDFSQLPDLRSSGRFSWNKQTLTLNDTRRDRTYVADFYIPVTSSPASVVVISHGLASDRTTLAYLATHLASYGFAVAVPEHPGSNTERLQNLLIGRASTADEPSEFINRPYDVTYLLDRLQALDAEDPTYQLNLDQVGVIGQSFGGYTALALAGAPINFPLLQKDCENRVNAWNISLLLQCRALALPVTQYNLRDPRIKAAIAINPLSNSIFGQESLSKINIPLMIVSSSDDTVAPALSEQIIPFSWLTTNNKYLVLLEGGTHFSALSEPDPSTNPLNLPIPIYGAHPALIKRYMRALSVAFNQTYVANNAQYLPYLSANYTKAIAQSVSPVRLVQTLPADLRSLLDAELPK
ncbi:MAG: alpha/beta hydrolase [Chroococcus sp. CMT-3BRIN-NPC107]|jgi:predicted dienelactone hydrolase|nr:alpha/beta hydrolase [Chroococcus sp. CMT-3BRIN-NPC107]